MRRSVALLAPILVAVAAALSSCGSAAQNAVDPVAKAATTTTNTHGARLAMSMTMTSDALPQPIHMTASGVMDQVAKQGRVDLDMSDLASSLGSGIDASKLHMTEVLDGTVAYMRMPLLDGKLPGHKKWMKIDIAKIGNAMGLNVGQLMQPGQDPSQQLGYLRTVAGAKKVGTETVRGVQTTHYSGKTRLDRYPDLLPKGQRAAARQAMQRLIKITGTSSIPIDAWIDHKGLLRRMHMKMTMNIPNAPSSITMDLQEDLFDFGVKVNVQPPADKDVYDATGTVSGVLKSQGLGG